MSNMQSALAVQDNSTELTLLDSIVEQSRIARNDEEHDRAKSLIAELAKEVMAGTITVSDNMSMSIDKRIAEIEVKLCIMLSFRKLNQHGADYITSVKNHLQIHSLKFGY